MSTNLWGKFFIQTQSKLCHSEGKAEGKVTANCTHKCKKYKEMRKLLLALDREMKGLEYLLDKENQKRKHQDETIKKVWGWFFNRKGSIYDVLEIYQPTIGVFDCSCRQNALNLTWSKRRRKAHEVCQNAKRINRESSVNP